ncbi:hypothetical protein [Bradyrhizobium sp. HKCCYLR1023]|uniref:hypothetical protein n=1 Tax=Bradyrhizobium TaxID=374 RepID=UPI003EBCBC04
MAAFLDICRFLPTTGGTTDWTYAAAVQGYQSPAAAGAVNGRLYKYRAESADLTQWEVGEGAYASSTGTLARTTILFTSAGTTAKVNFSAAPQVAIVALKEDLVSIEEANVFTSTQQAQARSNIAAAAGPGNWTRSVLTSGSGTYTLKAGCKALLVRMVGGGGGGGGGGTTGATFGGVGGDTTFGSSFLTASGGANGGPYGNAYASGGGAAGGDLNIRGSHSTPTDGAGGSTGAALQGRNGANSAFGGCGAGGWIGSAGSAAATNSGSGGGGGGGTDGGSGGRGAAGGGAGGYLEKYIAAPAATYAYSVGAAGSGGSAGANGTTGGAGGSGIIIIDEYY